MDNPAIGAEQCMMDVIEFKIYKSPKSLENLNNFKEERLCEYIYKSWFTEKELVVWFLEANSSRHTEKRTDWHIEELRS